MAMASAMGGVYAIPLIAFQTSGVFTNTTPVDAYRGAGKPEANYLIERCIDIAAHQLGMDGLKLRRKNIFRRFPHASAMGLTVEQGSFAHAIDHAVKAAAGFDARRQSSRKRGRLRGLGYACFLETSRGQPNEVAEVRLRRGRPDRSDGRHAFQRSGPRDDVHPDRGRRAWLAARALPVSAGRYGRSRLEAAGMAGRAPCTRAAPPC